jgi:hypothetical protein
MLQSTSAMFHEIKRHNFNHRKVENPKIMNNNPDRNVNKAKHDLSSESEVSFKIRIT